MKLYILDYKELDDYPSGSGIEYFNEKVYVIGDDAKDIMVVNKKWKHPEMIRLFDSTKERIPKKEKADFEATTIVHIENIPHLLILGSGSGKLRNKLLLVNLQTFEQKTIDISVFYERLAADGISDLNIEGAALMSDHIVFCNRGNKTHPDNHLIVTVPGFWDNQQEALLQLVRVDLDAYEGQFGLSGLTYAPHQDWLLFTTSMEDTPNSVDDGPIGKSYLGIVENAYRKIFRSRIKVNELIDLPATNKKFRSNKIESVCIQSEKDHSMKLHLVADNDTGKSYLFKVLLRF